MKTNYILIGVLIMLILASSASATWWDNDYAYKIPIKINNTNGLTITDYQINVSIPFGINASSIRVVNETSVTTVYHWCENVTDGGCYEVWFKAPHVPQNVWCNDTYAIYYGNDAIASTSDYDNTFTKTYNTTGLVLELHMDEGSGNSVAFDSSGEGNHGTLTNMNVTGNVTSGWRGVDGGQWDNRSDMVFSTGSQLLFDGIDDYVNCGTIPSLNGGEPITISALVCIKTDGAQAIFSLNENTLYIENNILKFQKGGTWEVLQASANSIVYDNWINVIFTRSGTGAGDAKLFINGNQNDDGVAIPNLAVAGDAVVGIHSNKVNWQLNGSIDEVRLYNRSLSEDEIYRQYIRSKYAPNAPTTVSITEQMIITKTLPLKPDIKAVQTLINMCSGIKLQLTILFDNAVNILPLIIAIAFMGIFSILIGKIFSTGLRIKK